MGGLASLVLLPEAVARGMDDSDTDPGPPPTLLSDLSIVCCCDEEDDVITGEPERPLFEVETDVAVVPVPLPPLLAKEFVLDVGVCRADSVAKCCGCVAGAQHEPFVVADGGGAGADTDTGAGAVCDVWNCSPWNPFIWLARGLRFRPYSSRPSPNGADMPMLCSKKALKSP
jgi:hypothetical protein